MVVLQQHAAVAGHEVLRSGNNFAGIGCSVLLSLLQMLLMLQVFQLFAPLDHLFGQGGAAATVDRGAEGSLGQFLPHSLLKMMLGLLGLHLLVVGAGCAPMIITSIKQLLLLLSAFHLHCTI